MDIAEGLQEKYPDINPKTVRFTDLRQKIMAIDGFDDDPARCNERVLEAVQGAWIELANLD